jgi:hypothetical protein
MAAFLHLAPPRGAVTAADDTVARLRRDVQATLNQQANTRPTLACHWTQDADGRLSCHWEIEAPDIPIPPD